MYAYIEENILQEMRKLPRAWRNISGLNLLDDIALAELGWHPVTIIDPAYDPVTQVRDSKPVDDWDGSTATRTYNVRDVTAQELLDKQRSDDLAVLHAAGKDLALVLTELVRWTLDNTSMAPTDFTTSVKDAYLDLKVIADRVK